MHLGFQVSYMLSDFVTNRYISILSVPATFATAFGFMFMYGKIMMSMSNSKLLPAFLGYRHPTTRAPYMALMVGSIVSFGVALVCLYYPSFYNGSFNICILSASFDYIWQLGAFILLRTKYQTIKCDFLSPFGLYGAVWSILVFALNVLAIVAFQVDQSALIVVAGIFAALTVWYFVYAKSRQSFSEEEKNTFFTIHVINCKYPSPIYILYTSSYTYHIPAHSIHTLQITLVVRRSVRKSSYDAHQDLCVVPLN